jgi:anti-sigma factor RsiW
MRCPIETPEGKELLLAHSTERLEAGRSALLDEHIQACPACRAFVAAQDAVWSALDAWEAAPVSADFDRRLYERIEKEVSWWDLLIRPFRPLMMRQGLPIAAAAVVLLVAGFLMQRPGGISLSSVPESAEVETAAPVAQEQAEHALQEMEMMREFNSLVRPEAGDPRM